MSCLLLLLFFYKMMNLEKNPQGRGRALFIYLFIALSVRRGQWNYLFKFFLNFFITEQVGTSFFSVLRATTNATSALFLLVDVKPCIWHWNVGQDIRKFDYATSHYAVYSDIKQNKNQALKQKL